MPNEGGCYCGAVRFQAGGAALFQGQCHCRECQYVSGGGPNFFMALPESEFEFTKGSPKDFQRGDLDNPVTRQFCAECGTHLLSKAPTVPGAVLIKVGTLDDPGVFGAPQMAIYTCDKQSFHHVPDGLAAFERTPG